MGSVTPYETAGGQRYRVRYRKPDNSQTDKRGFKTKREANLFLATVEVSKSRGAYVDPSRSRVSVEEWMSIFVDTRSDLRPSTLDRVQGIVRRNIVPQLGTTALADLNRLRVQEWASKLSATQSPWSVRKIVNVLSGALQLAVDDGRLNSNPAARLKLPKVSKVQKRYLSHVEVHALADAVERRGEGYGTIVLVLAYCGLRWGELAGLTWEDVDLERGRLEIRHTMIEIDGFMSPGTPKDYEERSIPVPAFLLKKLADSANSESGHVFVGIRSGGPLRNRVFRRGFFDAAAVEIGRQGLTPHEMRHTCASLAVSSGANVKALQRMLGHSSAKETLDTYADLFDADLDGVAHALDDVVSKMNVGKMWADTEKARISNNQIRA
ncbi:MAG: site-specific integrase [Rhodoglobus sp.]|nr:site-specific integrase [Rhodoglobus sp.]